MQTFRDVKDSLSPNESLSILFGNGFSQEWNSKIFNYESILKAADFGERHEILKSLFERFETYDFEAIMKSLEASEKILEAYRKCSQVLDQIRKDKILLKESLISAISNTHPDLPDDVTEEQYVAVRKFISGFENIYTLNYDLLLYWARNKTNLEPHDYETDDGFRDERRWVGYESEQQVHYLHGGLHIYDTKTDIKKHAYTSFGKTILDQVRENLKKDKFPLFVSEPDYKKKRNRIDHNPYLKYCYESIRNLEGTLFIYGHSMGENDKHIFDQIKKGKLERVYVSIFGDENNEENSRSKVNARTYLEGPELTVEFYEAESTPVWA